MLNIIILILKIIGFLLLAILALLLLLVLIILLAPLRYRITASIDGSLDSAEVSASFRWILRLVNGRFSYSGKEIRWQIRAAWKKYSSEDEEEAEEAVEEEAAEEEAAEEDTAEEDTAEEETAADLSEITRAREADAGKSEESEKAENERKKTPEPLNTGEKTRSQAVRMRRKKKSSQRKTDRAGSFIEKLRYTIRGICDNIKKLKQKKEHAAAFIEDPMHRRAFEFTLKETKKFLYRIRPDRGAANVKFGFKDPAHTGYMLAGVSMIWPAVAEWTTVTPDFEHQVLKGEGNVKGKIRLVTVAWYLWKLYWNRDVKTTYHHIKKFKL